MERLFLRSSINKKFYLDLSDKPLDQFFEAIQFTALSDLTQGCLRLSKTMKGSRAWKRFWMNI